jgi:hypothetical protein
MLLMLRVQLVDCVLFADLLLLPSTQVSPRQVDLRLSLVYETCMGRVGCGVNAPFHHSSFFFWLFAHRPLDIVGGWSLASEYNGAIKHRRETHGRFVLRISSTRYSSLSSVRIKLCTASFAAMIPHQTTL